MPDLAPKGLKCFKCAPHHSPFHPLPFILSLIHHHHLHLLFPHSPCSLRLPFSATSSFCLTHDRLALGHPSASFMIAKHSPAVLSTLSSRSTRGFDRRRVIATSIGTTGVDERGFALLLSPRYYLLLSPPPLPREVYFLITPSLSCPSHLLPPS